MQRLSLLLTELKNVDEAEVERVAENLRRDMDSIEADLDSLLAEGTHVIT